MKQRGGWMLVMGLSVAFGCVRPQAFPPPPAPEGALVGLWDLNGRYWGAGLRAPDEYLTLDEPYEARVAYFGCSLDELLGTPAGEQGCRPRTELGFRFTDSEPQWTPIDPDEPSEGCGCADLDPFVLRQTAPLRPGRPELLPAGATLLPGTGALPDVLVAFTDGASTLHYRVYGQDVRNADGEDVSSTLVLTSTFSFQSLGLWAERDGTVWSAGRPGLFRGEALGDTLRLNRVNFGSASSALMSSTSVRLEPISDAPLTLLLVEAGGSTILWRQTEVVELNPSRGLDEANHLRADRADLAPLYESGVLKGWALVGPAAPDRTSEDQYQATGYVVLRDGALGGTLPLPRIQAVAGSEELGTFGVDRAGGIFSLTEAGAMAREVGMSFIKPNALRIWDGHFVLARENAGVVHYTRPEFACSGRGNDLGNVKHLFPVGELLVEVATDGQVRWSRARSVCALPPA